MKPIPTAEEFSKNYSRLRSAMALKDLSEFAIEFAKLHVASALKEASKNAECYLAGRPGDYQSYEVKSESILKAYPIENIK